MKRITVFSLGIVLLVYCHAPARAADAPAAGIRGTEAGWVDLTGDDFTQVNCPPGTWTWEGNGVHCTGEIIGVTRTQKTYTNFELSVEWNHRKPAGNSGIFVWAPEGPLTALHQKFQAEQKGGLPKGIEVQVLDLGYKERYEKDGKRKATWFTCHGDVFSVGTRMTPFPPLSPDGSRSFPTAEHTRGSGEWNHYYIRCINGEVRLWVNGEEVSGGNQCDPATGYICLESEGSPIDFRNLRIRELP